MKYITVLEFGNECYVKASDFSEMHNENYILTNKINKLKQLLLLTDPPRYVRFINERYDNESVVRVY